MKDIKRDNKSVKDKLSEFSRVINDYNTILTDNIKLALWEYVKFRLFKRKYSKFTINQFRQMIIDLLLYCTSIDCIDNVTFIDIINNESQILYEIGTSIYYGNIHNLFYSVDELARLESIFESQNKKKLIKLENNANNKDVEDYFRSLMI